MTMEDTSAYLRHQSEFSRELDRRLVARIREAGRDDPNSEYIAWAVESQSEPIHRLERSSFTLPPDTGRFAGDESAAVLQDLLYEVWELNERYVGQPQVESYVQINGTPEQQDIIGRSLDWARDYVSRRLSRVSTRDRGCPYRRFLRLYNELVPFLDQLGIIQDARGQRRLAAITGQLLGRLCDYLAWSFFESTWMGDVVWDRSRALFRQRSDVDPAIMIECRALFSVYGWKAARVFDVLLARIAKGVAEGGGPAVSGEEELARIERLAADIRQMRPFLVRNFRPSKAVVELPGALVAHFLWNHNDSLGLLRCAESERELLSQEHRSEFDLMAGINYRGLLTCCVNPWRTVAVPDDRLPASALTVGRIVLEAVHERLFRFYDRIDLDAILARWRSADPEEPASAEDETMAIAASIALVEASEEPGSEPSRITSSLRLSRLRSLLERRFGCTARPGKGSELLFYRDGRPHAFVGRHKANPRVSAVEIQSILKKLGISVREWLGATCG